jgi:hypothetical protein
MTEGFFIVTLPHTEHGIAMRERIQALEQNPDPVLLRLRTGVGFLHVLHGLIFIALERK